MPFTLIRGSFHVAGYSPDGDSVRFRPDDAALLGRLDGFAARFNRRGHVQLRIEGIDAPETHYGVPGAVLHQPRAHAFAARDALLGFLDIADVRWDSSERTVVAARDGTPGHILARSVEKNGRPVAFVFAGPPDADAEDGSPVFLRPSGLAGSWNLRALGDGLAYPTFYRGLFGDLRAALTAATRAARAAGRGLHPDDVTTRGFDVDGLATITDEVTILPKLFRRLARYVTETGGTDGFKAALERAREPVLDLTTLNFTHFDSAVEQTDGSPRVALARAPEDLVFDEMRARPASPFAAVLEQGADFARWPPAT